jgi:hypothetical protein
MIVVFDQGQCNEIYEAYHDHRPKGRDPSVDHKRRDNFGREIEEKNIDNNREKSKRDPNQRKRNQFYDWLDDEIYQPQHRAGQNQPLPIAIEMNSMHQARRRPNTNGVR